MKKYENLGIIPPKDKDSFNRSLILKTFFWIFFPIAFLAILFLGFLKGLLISSGISLIGAIFVMFIADKFSGVAKILYGGRRNVISPREQMQSVLSTARIAKMNKNYSIAIEIIDGIIEQDHEYYEAMLVKAQILHEGFNKIDS
jgi:hypothetical protein